MAAQADGGAGVHFVGHSLGGTIARRAAARSENGRLRSLVTLGSPFSPAQHSPHEVAIFGSDDLIVPPPPGTTFPDGMYKRLIVLRHTGHLGVALSCRSDSDHTDRTSRQPARDPMRPAARRRYVSPRAASGSAMTKALAFKFLCPKDRPRPSASLLLSTPHGYAMPAATMTPPSAIILAGGRSSRMGLPKAALPFGASTILERLIDALSGGFAEIIVVAAPLSDEPFSIDHTLKRRIDASFENADADAPRPATFGKPEASHELDYRARRGCLRRARWRSPARPGPGARHNRLRLFLRSAPAATRFGRGPVRMLEDGAVAATPYDAAIPSIEGFSQPLCAAYRREPAIAALLAMEADDERRLTRLADQLKC